MGPPPPNNNNNNNNKEVQDNSTGLTRNRPLMKTPRRVASSTGPPGLFSEPGVRHPRRPQSLQFPPQHPHLYSPHNSPRNPPYATQYAPYSPPLYSEPVLRNNSRPENRLDSTRPTGRLSVSTRPVAPGPNRFGSLPSSPALGSAVAQASPTRTPGEIQQLSEGLADWIKQKKAAIAKLDTILNTMENVDKSEQKMMDSAELATVQDTVTFRDNLLRFADWAGNEEEDEAADYAQEDQFLPEDYDDQYNPSNYPGQGGLQSYPTGLQNLDYGGQYDLSNYPGQGGLQSYPTGLETLGFEATEQDQIHGEHDGGRQSGDHAGEDTFDSIPGAGEFDLSSITTPTKSKVDKSESKKSESEKSESESSEEE